MRFGEDDEDIEVLIREDSFLLTTEDNERITAWRVVIATGLRRFAEVPEGCGNGRSGRAAPSRGWALSTSVQTEGIDLGRSPNGAIVSEWSSHGRGLSWPQASGALLAGPAEPARDVSLSGPDALLIVAGVLSLVGTALLIRRSIPTRG